MPLRLGLRLMLPSGNVITLVRHDAEGWTCEYNMLARLRGEVVFSERFLQSRCVVC